MMNKYRVLTENQKMKSFREYLEESVLSESTLVQLANKTLSAMKSAFADQIKAGCEVYFVNDTMSGCTSANLAIPHPEGGEMFVSFGFMTEENDQELDWSEKKRLDKLDNLTAVFLSVNVFGSPLPDEMAKKIIASPKFKSSIKKVMDVVTSETGVKPAKDSSFSTSFTYEWRIVSNADLLKMAEKRYTTNAKALARKQKKQIRADEKRDAAIAKSFGF